jgi:hypothetical protein
MSDDISKRLPPNPAKRVPLQRVEGIHSAHARELVEKKEPFVTRVQDWECLQWDVEYLKQKIGHHPYPLIRVADGQPVEGATVADFLELSKDPMYRKEVMPASGGGPAFALQTAMRGVHPLLAELTKAYEVPAFVPPAHDAHILIRSSGMGGPHDPLFQTPAHWEFNAFAALFLQIRGRKNLWLFGPEEGPNLGMSSELSNGFPFLTMGAKACAEPEKYPKIANALCYEHVLEPGDLVYFPEYWFHWFTHYPEYQLNFRIFFPVKRHTLNPMSAAWAYSNALAEALGGFVDVEKTFNSLPESVKALLIRIEENLLTNPDMIDSEAVLRQRFSKTRMAGLAETLRKEFQASGGEDPQTKFLKIDRKPEA